MGCSLTSPIVSSQVTIRPRSDTLDSARDTLGLDGLDRPAPGPAGRKPNGHLGIPFHLRKARGTPSKQGGSFAARRTKAQLGGKKKEARKEQENGVHCPIVSEDVIRDSASHQQTWAIFAGIGLAEISHWDHRPKKSSE
ncbi:hypothetical protein THAOC_05514 [Thalassiosira oceanica]|uniref:Uncharacterized protein n=1 Tax=Thalassiosira oceanica TaxID=159749 RepID=K0TMR1_THAOC|nr:hypothetical protein THAOC_05514 [Thalassiosira oceanica]|eukprot:EJK72907.1 hypothetical protein THAOC_05514 [Thalassiosira oceanica]